MDKLVEQGFHFHWLTWDKHKDVEDDIGEMIIMMHTAPESVKRVKSIAQILVRNKMEVECLQQC